MESVLNHKNYNIVMKRVSNYLILFLIVMMVAPIASSEVQSLEDVKQGNCMNITQTCPSTQCTKVRITQVKTPVTIYVIDDDMSQTTDENYYWEFCNTTDLGEYVITTCDDPSDDDVCVDYNFEVTPSGNSGGSNTAFYIFIIVLVYAIALLGFFSKNEIVTLFGALAMIILGVYMIRTGVIIYRDYLTNLISYISIGMGFYFAFEAAASMWQDL